GKDTVAPGYFGQILGAADLPKLEAILRDGLAHAHQRALANAREKWAARQRFGSLGESLYSARLAPIEVHRAVVPATFELDPRQVPLAGVTSYVTDVSRAVRDYKSDVRFNFVSAITMLARELFCSSEGASIDQSYALTQGLTFVVAANEQGNMELYDFVGHQRGWELITKGVDDGYIRSPDLLTFSLDLARTTCELASAPPLKSTDKEAVVVTDPHYNTLLVHEIVGHPTELDRALKMETAYAGRTWLFKNLDENMVGQRIAAPLVNAFSDPSLPGYGHYDYDHEGTPAKRVVHIENGVFRGFMNSRQTAAILGVEPNGSYKATDASLVPLIRMSNTCFDNGDRDPQEIIREVDHGYYLVGHRIPSIAESRENFRITAQRVYEIRQGELGQVYKNGGIQADTKDFLMNVDAVGNDFRLYPIPNCGKGQPMQTKKLGNGGPTMRSRAKLSGT
ncbi:MAG: TldD/PmbA family protein, partial [Chloroflexi bacterium]|nr:TldD/PmbA family protein [Chloroflexota bacterium]